jgi:hypothetical protein
LELRSHGVLDLGEVQLDFIDETPAPVFAGFLGFHDRMFGRAKMFCCMFVFRRIAAANVPADPAQPKTHPLITHLKTLFTPLAARDDIPDLIRVRAFLHCQSFMVDQVAGTPLSNRDFSFDGEEQEFLATPYLTHLVEFFYSRLSA